MIYYFKHNTEANSSSTYLDYVASRAVDGNFSQHETHCFHSDVRDYITEAWLRIDLEQVYHITSVKFWYRNDSEYILIFYQKFESIILFNFKVTKIQFSHDVKYSIH